MKMLLFVLALAHAPLAKSDVRDDMRQASEYAARKKIGAQTFLRLEAQGTTVATALDLRNRPYSVGEQWWVAASVPTMEVTRKAQPPATTQHVLRIFHFQVTDVHEGRATVLVKPRDDWRALEIVLDVNRQTVEQRGSMILGGIAQFPVTIPRFNDDGARFIDHYPSEMPAELAPYDSALVDLRQGDTLAFDTEDSFSRPVHVIWRKGDPWPAYMSGAAGTAVLVRGVP